MREGPPSLKINTEVKTISTAHTLPSGEPMTPETSRAPRTIKSDPKRKRNDASMMALYGT